MCCAVNNFFQICNRFNVIKLVIWDKWFFLCVYACMCNLKLWFRARDGWNYWYTLASNGYWVASVVFQYVLQIFYTEVLPYTSSSLALKFQKLKVVTAGDINFEIISLDFMQPILWTAVHSIALEVLKYSALWHY